MAQSSEVNKVAFDIQAFICERAQDLAPEQSRQLLGQLQQLQGAYHQASGRAQAWANALSAQMAREEEWQRRERVKDEKDRERESAREREVWKTTTGLCRFARLHRFSQCNLMHLASSKTSHLWIFHAQPCNAFSHNCIFVRVSFKWMKS